MIDDVITIHLSVVLTIAIPIVLGLITYFYKTVISRINQLEERMQTTTTEPQVRQLINDRYDPLAQDIRDIKEYQEKLDVKLDKLFEIYVNSIKHSKD